MCLVGKRSLPLLDVSFRNPLSRPTKWLGYQPIGYTGDRNSTRLMGRHGQHVGYLLAVHEKQEANRAATASHGELPRLPSREGIKRQKTQEEGKNERRQDTRVPRDRDSRHI
ncbi:hypothetical protein AVEN_45209-1 [Araneus ventricosus]|uniref:Uncharacterized protein n=1 Tax=Araneus ventricosus TaxID=182803 RepID=A0A4Y1ZTL6_ARAVE|nr:hypothetical protein AVEN_45209-1 [Araneus ventricosus]